MTRRKTHADYKPFIPPKPPTPKPRKSRITRNGRKPLTGREAEYLEFHYQYSAQYGAAPSSSIIAAHFQITSGSARLTNRGLQEKGYLVSLFKGAIPILVDHGVSVGTLPIAGVFTPGSEIRRHPENTKALTPTFFTAHDPFVVQVSGEGLEYEFISDGDWIICKAPPDPVSLRGEICIGNFRGVGTLGRVWYESDIGNYRIKMAWGRGIPQRFAPNFEPIGQVLTVMRNVDTIHADTKLDHPDDGASRAKGPDHVRSTPEYFRENRRRKKREKQAELAAREKSDEGADREAAEGEESFL